MAGLAALGGEFDLIGIHDAARPAIPRDLVERLFSTAARVGGAVPVIAAERILLDRKTHQPVAGIRRAQTPQVFMGREIMIAYVRAAQAGVDAQDTVEIMQRFSDVAIAALPGDPDNIKVTYPDDLRVVAQRLTTRPRT
jgi:2-C-methyl-D-erythritol 4-phosphate cytidylyltransferase